MSAQPATIPHELLNPFCSVPDSLSWALLNSLVRLRLPDSESVAETHFSKLVLEAVKLWILIKEGGNLFVFNNVCSTLHRSGDNELWFLSEANNAPAAEAAQALKPPGLKGLML